MSNASLSPKLLAMRIYILTAMAIDRKGKADYATISAQLDASIAEFNRRDDC